MLLRQNLMQFAAVNAHQSEVKHNQIDSDNNSAL